MPAGTSAKTTDPMRLLAPLALVLTFSAMMWWSWATWPDVIIDFGRELYTPWQLAQGNVLYRDVESFYGPLSPYVNALWFILLGTSLRTLETANLLVLAVLTFLIFRLMREIASAGSSTIACMVFLLLFAFSQYVDVGNYNFVCPYAHEATHGFVLSIAVLLVLARFLERQRAITALGLGFLIGLVFLTKPEPFVAIAPIAVMGLILTVWGEGMPLRPAVSLIGCFVAGALAPPLIALGLLATAMPLAAALRGVLGSWPFVFDDQLRQLPFFRIGMGTDDVNRSATRLLSMLGWSAAIMAPATALSWLAPARFGRSRWVMIAGFTVGTLAMLPAWRWRMWLEVARPLPVYMIVAAVAIAAGCVRRRPGRADRRTFMALAVVAFAGLMLLKLILYARIYHYGFVLALPATLVTVVMVLDWIPNWLDRRARAGGLFRALMLGVLAVVVAAHLRIVHRQFSNKPFALASGDDLIVTHLQRGQIVGAALKALAQVARPGDTLLVLPEGVMLNFLSRRETPTRFLTFLPSDLIMFGEQTMLQSLQASPPDFIVLAHADSSDFGARFFGRDYAESIAQWMRENYHVIARFGRPPFVEGTVYGMTLLQHNTAGAPSHAAATSPSR